MYKKKEVGLWTRFLNEISHLNPSARIDLNVTVEVFRPDYQINSET